MSSQDLVGYLKKSSPSALKGWQKRWFVLKFDEKRLYYYKKKGDFIEAGSIDLGSATIKIGKAGEFTVRTKKRDYPLHGGDVKVMQTWVDRIKLSQGNGGDQKRIVSPRQAPAASVVSTTKPTNTLSPSLPPRGATRRVGASVAPRPTTDSLSPSSTSLSPRTGTSAMGSGATSPRAALGSVSPRTGRARPRSTILGVRPSFSSRNDAANETTYSTPSKPVVDSNPFANSDDDANPFGNDKPALSAATNYSTDPTPDNPFKDEPVSVKVEEGNPFDDSPVGDVPDNPFDDSLVNDSANDNPFNENPVREDVDNPFDNSPVRGDEGNPFDNDEVPSVVNKASEGTKVSSSSDSDNHDHSAKIEDVAVSDSPFGDNVEVIVGEADNPFDTDDATEDAENLIDGDEQKPFDNEDANPFDNDDETNPYDNEEANPFDNEEANPFDNDETNSFDGDDFMMMDSLPEEMMVSLPEEVVIEEGTAEVVETPIVTTPAPTPSVTIAPSAEDDTTEKQENEGAVRPARSAWRRSAKRNKPPGGVDALPTVQEDSPKQTSAYTPTNITDIATVKTPVSPRGLTKNKNAVTTADTAGVWGGVTVGGCDGERDRLGGGDRLGRGRGGERGTTLGSSRSRSVSPNPATAGRAEVHSPTTPPADKKVTSPAIRSLLSRAARTREQDNKKEKVEEIVEEKVEDKVEDKAKDDGPEYIPVLSPVDFKKIWASTLPGSEDRKPIKLDLSGIYISFFLGELDEAPDIDTDQIKNMSLSLGGDLSILGETTMSNSLMGDSILSASILDSSILDDVDVDVGVDIDVNLDVVAELNLDDIDMEGLEDMDVLEVSEEESGCWKVEKVDANTQCQTIELANDLFSSRPGDATFVLFHTTVHSVVIRWLEKENMWVLLLAEGDDVTVNVCMGEMLETVFPFNQVAALDSPATFITNKATSALNQVQAQGNVLSEQQRELVRNLYTSVGDVVEHFNREYRKLPNTASLEEISSVANDKFNKQIGSLVRGKFGNALHQVLSDGFFAFSLFGKHSVWDFISNASTSRSGVGSIFNPSQLALAQTVSKLNSIKAAYSQHKLRCWICAGLSGWSLHGWMETLANNEKEINRFYYAKSIWRQSSVCVLEALELLNGLPFRLNTDPAKSYKH